MTEKRIPIYDKGLSLMAVQSYLSMNGLIERTLASPGRKAVYVLKDHGGRIVLEHSLPETKMTAAIWNVTFSDRVNEKVVKDLSERIEARNEIIRENYRRNVA